MSRLLLIAAMLLVVPSVRASSAAQETGQPEAAGQSDNERLFKLFLDQFYAGNYAAANSAARQMSDPGHKEGRAILEAVRGAAQLGLKQEKQAARHFAEAQRLAPMDPFLSTLQFDAGLLTENMAVAAVAFDRLIGRFPDVARGLDWSFVRHFLRNEPKGQERSNEDRQIALARLGYGSGNVYGDDLALSAVEFLMKRGDAAGVRELLPHIDEPRLVEDLLIQKRFASFWPQIEALAGPHLEKVRASSAAAAERAHLEDPDDLEKLQLLVSALRQAGRLGEAVAFRSKVPAAPGVMASASEQAGWLVNDVAFALYEDGRGPEGDQLFAMLNEPVRPDARWRVSMLINRLELLVSDGQFQKAETLLAATETSARNDGNSYAQQLVRRLRYCTLSGLGRPEDASKLLPDVLKHAEDAPGPTIDALLCAGQSDQAEAVALGALKKEKFHADFVRALQARPLTSDDPSVWASGWKELRARPAIAAEFNRLGRDIPEHLLAPKFPKAAKQGATTDR